MIRHVVFAKPKLLRRICSVLIDFLLVLLIGVFTSFIVDPIVQSTDTFKNYEKTYYEYADASGLFTFDESNNILNETNPDNEEYLIHFYYDLLPEGKGIYDRARLDSNLYDYNSQLDSFSVKENVSEDELLSFYQKMHYEAVNTYFEDYMKVDPISAEASYNLAIYNLLELVISSFVALLVVYLLIPLLSKKSKTLGMTMFRLEIISTKSVCEVSKVQILFRGLIIILVEILSSMYVIYLCYVPLFILISFIMMVFTKNQLSFHDLVCQTAIIDNESNINNLRENEKMIISYNVEEENGK